LQVQKKTESKLLDRSYVEVVFDEGAGKITRKDAAASLAKELGVQEENVGVVSLEGQSGTKAMVGRFHVYGSKEAKSRLHRRYLEERSLTKEEREKLKQERKKAKAPAPAAAPEAKK
jgi:ribosomal protein S24E